MIYQTTIQELVFFEINITAVLSLSAVLSLLFGFGFQFKVAFFTHCESINSTHIETQRARSDP